MMSNPSTQSKMSSNVMKKQPQHYEEDESPIEESKNLSKLNIQMANTNYEGFGGNSQVKNYYQ